MVVVPKLVGIGYYEAVRQGVEAAAAERPDLRVQWQGTEQDRADAQAALLERIIATRPALVAVATNDPVTLSPVLARAVQAGVRVMAWDADVTPREFFVNLVDFDEFGQRLVQALVADAGSRGDIAIITTSFSAPNQTRWIEAIKRTLYARHPGLRLIDTRPAGESTEEAARVTRDLLRSHPALKGLIVLGAPNLPGAAQALRELRRAEPARALPALTGNSTPNAVREYLLDGTFNTALGWNARDHGYLTVHAAWQLLNGGIQAGTAFQAGRMGQVLPRRDKVNAELVLPTLQFTRDNVDQFRF
ncbi:substrate-binding domain-containing protein (plasmid) [Aquabacterium sp. OR-4]|nr:substrate-binding domain-containing protein [Aquabacterium sp. OR-4]MDT7838339.1 substrate-binding domain-containing protein [Aquabacterium sp. OR-4]